MSSKSILIIVLLAVLAIAYVFWWGTNKNSQNGQGSTDPAITYCTSNDGVVNTATTEDGIKTTYCIFKDHSSCEVWAYYRNECVPGEINNN